MTTLIEFAGQPPVQGMVHVLGWTLLHFVWQRTAAARYAHVYAFQSTQCSDLYHEALLRPALNSSPNRIGYENGVQKEI